MNSWHMRRLLGAFVALISAVLFALSLILPLFVGTVSARNLSFTMEITAWGFRTDAPTQVGVAPVNAYPLVFATVGVLAAAVVAFVAARMSAGPANRRAAWICLALAAALSVGVTATITPQLSSWLSSFRSTGAVAANTDTAVGLGFWSLVAATVLVVAAAAHAALPIREPEIATPPYGFPLPSATPADEPPPANVDPHGTGGSA
jgi:hypothetical protein